MLITVVIERIVWHINVKVYMTEIFFSVFKSLIRVQNDFKNKTCQNCLKISFLKNVAGLGPNLPHSDVTLLDFVPGSVVFWLQIASKCSHSAALFAFYPAMFSNLSIAPVNKNKQGRNVSRFGLYQTIND